MRCLILDGHPDGGRLLTHLLDAYAAALPAGTEVERIAVRDLAFDPNLRRGYAKAQPLEPDLQRLMTALDACDHLVIGFPMWWGAEPGMLKGLIDRVLLPGWAFQYHRDDPMWDRLLAGRSADLVVTMDTPPWYLRLAYGDAVIKRWTRQVLGFVGFKPVRVFRFGPTRKGGAEKGLPGWTASLHKAAGSAAALNRAAKLPAPLT
ncbi:NAD(P)H-dependent oxidoreductase [Novosphingobium sp.]|uniref:NAD(P)H-dependent oxidoreductase n=1 Tax=Novosphingobium sp. TaxID=1874826 RepID=UPI0025F0D491|nr:NAD(P)H-dependent oxidoreductase [Novosphingobium sp.]MCC6925860.1 NAD(P)H-dependent oxidoreductase [Novosphingobium sp.]